MEKVKRPVWWKIILICSIVLATAIIAALSCVAYYDSALDEYYGESAYAFAVPDVESGFVPCGTCYVSDTSTFIFSGYMKDGSASPVCFVDGRTGGKIKTIFLENAYGEVFKGKLTGVAVYGKYLFVASVRVYVYLLDDALEACDNSTIECLGAFGGFEEDVNACFLEVGEDGLIVGEYYNDGESKTESKRNVVTASGEAFHSLAFVYRFDKKGKFGLEDKPSECIALPDAARGMCFYGDDVYVCSSDRGLGLSSCYSFSFKRAKNAAQTVSFSGKDLPLYVLGKDFLNKKADFPPVCGDITLIDKRIYTVNATSSVAPLLSSVLGASGCYSTSVAYLR